MRQWAVAFGVLVLAFGAAACGDADTDVESHAWTLTFPAGNDTHALPVIVQDETGIVAAVGVDNGFKSFQFGATPVAGRPDAIAIGWLGGMCDQQVTIVVTRPQRWQVDVKTRSGDICRLAGISRSVILATRQPIDVATIDVVSDGHLVRR